VLLSSVKPARLGASHVGHGTPDAVVSRSASGAHSGVVVPWIGDAGALAREPFKNSEEAERVVDGAVATFRADDKAPAREFVREVRDALRERAEAGR
jgi:hypothetical protein